MKLYPSKHKFHFAFRKCPTEHLAIWDTEYSLIILKTNMYVRKMMLFVIQVIHGYDQPVEH